MSLPRQGIRTETKVGNAGTAGETAVWTYNSGELWDGTSRLIIALHGHGTAGQDVSSPSVFGQNFASGKSVMALARTGRYIICSIQAGGVAAWSKPSVMTNITNAVVAARTRGAKTGKYGLMGWSMGGLAVANKIKRDSANIAAAVTFSAAADLDYIYSTAGHTPIANNAGWTTEVNAAFGNYANTAGYRVWDEPASFRVGVPWKLYHGTVDAVIPASVSSSLVTAINDPLVTYRPVTGRDHTNLFTDIPDSEIIAHFDSATWS